MTRTLVLAEPGCSAEGDYAAFVRLIHAAKAADCDVFKASWVSNVDQMMARRHITPEHEAYDFYREAYGWLAFNPEWHADFARICKDVGIAYACSVYLPCDVETLAPHVEYLKISSFEAGDLSLRGRAINSGVQVIVSLGIGMAPKELCAPAQLMLHCVSAYPAPLSALNLKALRYVDGLSDHSRNLLTGAVAVGAGAEILETHFRLHDCSPNNPDYAVAFNPDELKQYVGNVRQAEEMMGDGVKRLQACEEWATKYRVGGSAYDMGRVVERAVERKAPEPPPNTMMRKGIG